MDISTKTWLLIIGVVLIVAVLLDGYRRMRRQRNIGFGEMKEVPAKQHTSELPNGGARVISRESDEALFAKESLDSQLLDDESWDVDVPVVESENSTSTADSKEESFVIDELFVINLHNKNQDENFDGQQLLDTLLAIDLTFGDMDIFHYLDRVDNKKSSVMFSVANGVEPGIFDVDNMDEYPTPGLSFFMTLPSNSSPLKSYDTMLDCAEKAAKLLHADLKDSELNLLTVQSCTHDRQRIEEYMRKSFRSGMQ